VKTYGDSTKTPGQHIDDRCYILAQLPEESNLDWARDLRTAVGGDELKYKKYLELRHYVQAKTALWKRVRQGTSEATVVVIESGFYINAIALRLRAQGAELDHDFTIEDLLREAAITMINHAPVMRIRQLEADLRFAVPPKTLHTPEVVYKQLGGKLTDATVFAARAHAAFDLDDLQNAASTNELFLGPYGTGILSKVRGIDRVFDKEHPRSAAVLNEIFLNYDTPSSNLRWNQISESSSEGNDALQAADFCAGYASELMMNAIDDREKELRRHFRRVIYNGATR